MRRDGGGRSDWGGDAMRVLAKKLVQGIWVMEGNARILEYK